MQLERLDELEHQVSMMVGLSHGLAIRSWIAVVPRAMLDVEHKANFPSRRFDSWKDASEFSSAPFHPAE